MKVEFGEGEGKEPYNNIAKRAEAYKLKERVTYKNRTVKKVEAIKDALGHLGIS